MIMMKKNKKTKQKKKKNKKNTHMGVFIFLNDPNPLSYEASRRC